MKRLKLAGLAAAFLAATAIASAGAAELVVYYQLVEAVGGGGAEGAARGLGEAGEHLEGPRHRPRFRASMSA